MVWGVDSFALSAGIRNLETDNDDPWSVSHVVSPCQECASMFKVASVISWSPREDCMHLVYMVVTKIIQGLYKITWAQNEAE